jgi:Trypsin
MKRTPTRRFRALKIAFVMCAPFTLFRQTHADQIKPKQNSGDLSLQSVLDLGQSGLGPKVRGADEAVPAEWQASFYSKGDTLLGIEPCSAALIGPHVLLTAAHCVGNHRLVSFSFNGKPFAGPCDWSNTFIDGDDSADIALCFISDAAPVPYENISTDPTDLKVATRITLTGFGCTSVDETGAGRGNESKKYLVGDATIVKLPGQQAGEENSIITEGEVAICFGDSGGPAFLRNSLSGSRRVVGVNSHFWKDNNLSSISSLTTPAAVEDIKKWRQAGPNRAICGTTPKPLGCR